MDRRSLKLLNWNACSIRRKNLELVDFLREKEIDVAAITETHLKPGEKVYLQNYKIATQLDRTTSGGGGVLVAVHRDLKPRRLPHFKLDIIEAVGVEIPTSVGPVLFIAAYCPRQVNSRDGSAAKLKGDIQKLTRRSAKYIIAGDLNAKHEVWGNSRRNRNGVILHNDLQNGYYNVVSPDRPTRVARSGNHSIIDFFITNMAENVAHPEVFEELSSDHYPVVVEVGASVTPQRQPTRKDYHNVDWQQFQQVVDSNIDYDQHPETSADIDRSLEVIQQAINQAEAANVREVPVNFKVTDIDVDTKHLIRLRNVYRRQYQRTGDYDKKISVNNLNKIIQDRLDNIRNQEFSKHVSQLGNYSKPFWKLSKVLKNKPKPIPPLIVEDSPLITSEEKANALGLHFVSSHNLGASMTSRKETSVANSISTINDSTFEFPADSHVSGEEVKVAVKQMKNMKAPGFDNIFNLVLKKQSDQFFQHLANIFNKCLQLGYFPTNWKLGKVIPILKPQKDPTSPTSYRPISLLSSLSKLFEKVIYSRLLDFTNDNNIILNEQFGFRKGHNTAHQLTRVTKIIKQNKLESKSTAMALLDVEKAFDNVWHDGLIHKLYLYGFPMYLIKIIQHYLSERSFRVFLNGIASGLFNIDAGVPQGSILGPLLYNIFTSDLPTLPGNGVLSLFADDTAVIYKGKITRYLVGRLQKGLDVLSEYFGDWKIRINAAKTQTIIFPLSKSARFVPKDDVLIKMNDVSIPWSKEVVYLGLILDSKLLFRQHVDKILNKCSILIRCLYPLINRKSKLSLKNKLAVYKQIIYPVIEYAVPVWECCARTHKLKLQRVQNKVLKMVLNVPGWTRSSEVHELAEVKMLDQKIQEKCLKFREKCAISEYPLIQGLV